MQKFNTPQTIGELDKIITSQSDAKKSTGIMGYIFWGLAIPPISTIWSIYAANKKGLLHLLIPTMTIVYTILFALFSVSIIYSPKSFSDVSAVKFATKVQIPSVPSWIVVSTILLTIFGILGGWYLRGLAKQQGYLSKTMMAILLIILGLQFFIEFRELAFISSAINQSVGDIYQGL